MNLIAFDFWIIVLIALGLFLLGIAGRIARALARFSERLIIFIAQSGLPGVAKAWLAILIGYDERVYRRSRFEFRNQVGYRFSLFWGSFLALALLLWLLSINGQVEEAVTIWLALFITYIGLRSLLYWSRPDRHADQDDHSFSPHVKERNRSGYGQSPTLIRHWDYLDELFGQST